MLVCRKQRSTTNDAVCRRLTKVIPLVVRPEYALALVESCVALDSGRGTLAAITRLHECESVFRMNDKWYYLSKPMTHGIIGGGALLATHQHSRSTVKRV